MRACLLGMRNNELTFPTESDEVSVNHQSKSFSGRLDLTLPISSVDSDSTKLRAQLSRSPKFLLFRNIRSIVVYTASALR